MTYDARNPDPGNTPKPGDPAAAKAARSSHSLLVSQHPPPLRGRRGLRLAQCLVMVVLGFALAACGGSGGGSGGGSSSDGSSSGDSGSGSGADSGDTGGGSDPGTGSSAVAFTFSPEHQATNVATGRTIVIEPDTGLDASSLTPDAVYIEGPDGVVDATLDYADSQITLAPNTALAPDSDYMVRVTTDVATADGNEVEEPAYSSFRTMALAAQPPALQQWESNMVNYGEQWGSEFLDSSNGYILLLNYFYYDAERVYYQIADYTGEAEPWNTYAEAARAVYATYLTDNNFGTSGYWRFPHGLYMDWNRNGSSQARSYLIQLRDAAAFSDPDTSQWSDGWYEQRYSREVAYALQNHMLAERAGEARLTERVDLYVDMALRHIESWTTGNWVTNDSDWQFVQAFMAGLTASALIDYHERSVDLGSPDARVPDALETLADWLWANMWVGNINGSGHGAFSYVTPSVSGVGSEAPAPDLSLLIAPLYAWLYRETGATRHLERGDAVFEGGVELADLNGSKRFNQSYRASFDYIDWRAAGYQKFGD